MRCAGCENFIPSRFVPGVLYGRCVGEPWNGASSQAPRHEHPCAGYRAGDEEEGATLPEIPPIPEEAVESLVVEAPVQTRMVEPPMERQLPRLFEGAEALAYRKSVWSEAIRSGEVCVHPPYNPLTFGME